MTRCIIQWGGTKLLKKFRSFRTSRIWFGRFFSVQDRRTTAASFQAVALVQDR